MRAMRDAGIGGHVLLCGKMNEADISLLARDNVFFFPTAPDEESLRILMEHQRRVAVNKKMLEIVFDLANEYDLHQLIVMDPDDEAIRLALSHLDPDQVMAGGYCYRCVRHVLGETCGDEQYTGNNAHRYLQ